MTGMSVHFGHNRIRGMALIPGLLKAESGLRFGGWAHDGIPEEKQT